VFRWGEGNTYYSITGELRLALSKGPNRLGVSLPWPDHETDPVSETTCFLDFAILEDGQNPNPHWFWVNELCYVKNIFLLSNIRKSIVRGLHCCFLRILSQSRSRSRSYMTTDGQSASLSWCQALVWDPLPIYLLLSYFFLDSYEFIDVGRPLWREVGSVVFSFFLILIRFVGIYSVWMPAVFLIFRKEMLPSFSGKCYCIPICTNEAPVPSRHPCFFLSVKLYI
jgi:hypothetical protein